MKFILKSSLLIISLLNFSIAVIGQTTADSIPGNASGLTADGAVSGKIVDASTKKPVDYVSVALIRKSDNVTVKAAQTDLNGNFKMDNIAYGSYQLKASFVGYQPFARDSIAINAGRKTVNLGTINLGTGKANVLQEVVVEAQRNAIQLGIDRKVFNVEQSLVSQGGSATDLLANIPTVSVDIDGNVSLRGTSNVRVLIDGKPSAIGSGDISKILESLPASAIENIELITNPSSKYDAEGQTGIINIVLKKNRKVGLNGSVALTAGNRDNYNANSNLSYRDEKVNLYGNYSFRNGNRLGGGFSNTRFINSNGIVNNNSDSRRTGLDNNFKLGADYFINSKTTIGVSGNFSFEENESFEDLNYLFLNIPDQNGSSFRTSDRNGDEAGYDLSLDFNRQLKRKGESLVGNFSFGQQKEDENQDFIQNFFSPDGSLRDTIDRRVNGNGEFTNSLNVQVDYTLPINQEQKLEAGYRSTIRKDEETQTSDVFNPAYDDFVRDYNLTNDFSLDDIVHAVYTSYQNQITKNLGFQAGLRAEQAYLNTTYTGVEAATLRPTTVDGKLDYFRIYPSFFVTQKLKADQQLQLSYTRRVNRPRGWQINPFRDISDPNNIRVGNPGLRPEDIHSFELGYIQYWKSVTFTTSAYFRQVNDVVEGIRQRITDNNAATITQFFNLTKSRSTGLELISKADIVKGFNLTGNFNLFYNKFDGNEEFNIQGNSGVNWNANLTGNIQFPKNISAQFNTQYMAPRVSPQGRSTDMYGMDAGLRMDVLKNKAGSISLNVRDVFNTYRWGQTTQTFEFIQDSERRMLGRMANLTFSYRFGRQDNSERKRENREGQQPDMEEGQF